MRNPMFWLVTASLALGGAVRGHQDAPAPPAPELASLVKTYCVTCHNDRLKTAGLSLQSLDLTNVPGHGQIWEKVARKLRSGEMPPANVRSRPDARTAEAFAAYLETTLDRAALVAPQSRAAPRCIA